MANLTSEQEELLKEIKSTFGGESEQVEKKEQVENEENPAEESLTEENAFKESTAEAKEAEEDVPLDPMSDKTTDVLKEASSSKKDTLEEDFDTAVKISNNKAMPKYGPGFKYVPIISGITLVAVILGHIGPLAGGVPANKYLRYIYVGIGVLILAWGVSLILNAINECAILLNAQMGKLVTTGIYSKTRNPMYTGVTFVCTAALFFSGNVYTYFLPVLYWLFMSYLMANTEEELLEKNFGQNYLDYKNGTYRFMPFKKRS